MRGKKGLPPFGSLEDHPVPRLFSEIYLGAKTGLLVLNSGGDAKLISLSAGAPAAVQSNVPTDTLGHYLLGRGLVSRELFDKADAIVRKTGRDEGNVFVELGALNPNTLFEAISANQRQKILSCFAWTSGEFVYEELQELLPETVPVKLATPRLIIDGILAHYTTDRMGNLLTLPASAAAVPNRAFPYGLDKLGLSGEEQPIYQMAASGMKVVDILARAKSKKLAFGLLYALECMEVIGFSPSG